MTLFIYALSCAVVVGSLGYSLWVFARKRKPVVTITNLYGSDLADEHEHLDDNTARGPF